MVDFFYNFCESVIAQNYMCIPIVLLTNRSSSDSDSYGKVFAVIESKFALRLMFGFVIMNM